MRGGREISDLIVFKKENTILDVIVYRPLLNFRKNLIYSFADNYQIPYFLDTTPNWSCRGKMRRNIFPSCEDCYGENYKNSLLKLANQGQELGKIIDVYIIKSLLEKVIFNKLSFKIELEDVLNEEYILRNLLYRVCLKLKIAPIKQKNIRSLLDHINNKSNKTISVLKNYNTFIDKNLLCFACIV